MLYRLDVLFPVSFKMCYALNSLFTNVKCNFSGKSYPLNGKRFVSHKGEFFVQTQILTSKILGGLMHSYYCKVVPTIYQYEVTQPGVQEFTFQFSVTRNEKDLLAGASGLPGFFVQYSFSPLLVKFYEHKKWIFPPNKFSINSIFKFYAISDFQISLGIFGLHLCNCWRGLYSGKSYWCTYLLLFPSSSTENGG